MPHNVKTFIILGMHRSATSLVAKGLSEAGVFMGKNLLRADSGNPHGYFEDLEFLNLNKMLLTLCGNTWLNPPSAKEILELKKHPDVDHMIKTLVEKRNTNQPLWGFKDPRAIFTIPLFLPFLENPHFIACFREPEEIAKSLQKRNGLAIESGLALAKIYHDRTRIFLSDYYGGKY